MNKILIAMALFTACSSAAFATSEENSGKATVEKSTSLMGTKKTKVKQHSKVKDANGAEVDKNFEDTTKVHKDGKVTQDTKESVEVTPPDKK